IVHRDIKPENILLDKKGQVKIADFGVAKMIAESLTEAAEKTSATLGELTEAGSTLGTLQYMAPEQIKNSAEVDHRADIYSLGVVFYQMLTGKLPSGKIEPPSRKLRIDVRLDEIVLRALEKEPARRYQHVSEVGTDVETISRSSPNAKPKTSMKKPTLLFVLGAGAFCLLLAFVLFVFHGRSTRTLTIRAFIDGSDVVYVSGYKLWIQHDTANLPGKLIYVNGQPWTPTWTTNGTSSEFDGLNPAFMPHDPQTIHVTKLVGRGTVSLEQFPSAENNQTLAVRISDDVFPGAAWYEIAISWNGRTKSAATGTRASPLLSASNTQAPLPDDISIQPPPPAVSTKAAAFSGAWVGEWGHELAGALIVEDISSHGTAHVIYSWGKSSWCKAGWTREIGYISHDDLRLREGERA
ncbi:MAG: serine/threonine-protein kinase, partial [Limisphaerales bacterium]